MKNKKCPFCEAMELQKFIYKRNAPEGIGNDMRAALVIHSVINEKRCGRTTDYMKDGKGFPLNFCPSCGERVKK